VDREYIKTAVRETKKLLKVWNHCANVAWRNFSRTPDSIMNWAAKQAYIAFGFGLAACAELAIDSCPMEVFKNAEVDAILGLPSHMRSQAFLALGYRADDAKHARVRFPKEKVFTTR
jgi:nitroreductase